MAGEPGQQDAKQGRTVRFGLDFVLERGRLVEPVAQEREVPRAAAPRGEAAERTADVGHGLEAGADALAADGVLDQPMDQTKACLDRRTVGERRGKVLAQHSAAGGALAAVDLAEQASGDAPAGGAGELEAVAAGGVDRHVRIARYPAREVEKDVRAALRRVEISEQSPGRGELGPRWRAKPVERGQAEAAFERAFAFKAVEARSGDRLDSGHGLGSDDLCGLETRDLRR